LKQRARTEADNMVRNAEKQIEMQTTRAMAQIRQEAVDLSVTNRGRRSFSAVSKEDNEK